jgi:beta-phosphoglucomutase-like phosphatase (HAD superfamily)
MSILAEVRALGRRRVLLEAELSEEVRPELVAAIRAAAAQGHRQVDIVKASGYTREMVRRILAQTADPITPERGTP